MYLLKTNVTRFICFFHHFIPYIVWCFCCPLPSILAPLFRPFHSRNKKNRFLYWNDVANISRDQNILGMNGISKWVNMRSHRDRDRAKFHSCNFCSWQCARENASANVTVFQNYPFRLQTHDSNGSIKFQMVRIRLHIKRWR